MNEHSDVIDFFLGEQTQFQLKQFRGRVKSFFEENPKFKKGVLPVVHSVKSRIKILIT